MVENWPGQKLITIDLQLCFSTMSIMGLTGVIPTVVDNDERNPYKNPCPFELAPVDLQIVRGEGFLRPVSQLVVEGMIVAGVEQIIFVVAEGKESLMKYYGDGKDFGIPIQYVWGGRYNLCEAVNSVYNLVSGDVIVCCPGVTNRNIQTKLHIDFADHKPLLSMTVAQNTILDERNRVTSITQGTMTGVFCWDDRFREYLREYVSELDEGHPELEDVLLQAIDEGRSVRGYKSPFAPVVTDGDSWEKAVIYVQQQKATTVHRLEE